MSIRINNETIAGNYEHKPTSYRYIGEIFQSAIPIQDDKVACLDGHKVYEYEGYGSFVQYVISQSMVYPQIVCTEEVWQEKVAQYGSWGQFVINAEENSIRLPKISCFVQGLNTLEDLAGLLEAGLPNIEGKFWDLLSSSGISSYNGTTMGGANGAFYTKAFEGTNDCGTITANGLKLSSDDGIGFDASLSSPIYGKSTTVQPQSIQYPYYIVLATGVVQEINIKKDINLNTPFFLGMSEYFENTPNNLSWLKSEGQWNSKDVYVSYYEWLEKKYNEGDENVKLVTEEYDDYNFVINQEEGTFRLPLLNGSENVFDNSVASTELTSGQTVDKNGFVRLNTTTVSGGGHVFCSLNINGSSCWSNSCDLYRAVDSTYLPIKKGDTASYTINGNTSSVKLTFKPAINIGSLYYYVGETVQNANLINVPRIIENIENKADINASNFSNAGKSAITHIAMPSLKYTNLTIGATGTTYTMPSDGYMYLYAQASMVSFYGLYNDTRQYGTGNVANGNGYLTYFILPVNKGDIVSIRYQATASVFVLRFFYANGSESEA